MFIVVAIAACAPVSRPLPPAGASETFESGYWDGCASGYDFAGSADFHTAFRRDDPRYAAGNGYRDGWDRGYLACFADQRLAPRLRPEN